MRVPSVILLLGGLSLLPAQTLSASCPRTGGEKTRRVVASLAFYPAAPFIYFRGQRAVPMPVAGTSVRVSHEVEGKVHFAEGLFVSAADSVLRIATATGDTATFPYQTARCLQVRRQSGALGAAFGLATGFLIGTVGGTAIGMVAAGSEPSAPIGGMFLGAAAGIVLGPIVGYRKGATVWDVAWERKR
ncbi:hypothetical protein [Gemmatimonas phototrophica]|uniref:Glycine zipper domain-containing protein n=1 Tax=Gemmatimonas phototrophica TaxID=1379270 RepID=A0A143BNL7_9BACT|nr:hypothetical protein [Gemmatimonas phototrophica]AMW06024.1 hypothetical protein GEMMAAP_16995 [Gemmatimonas phototrophica]